MYPFTVDEMARERIRELHREAAAWRLAKRGGGRRVAVAGPWRRAVGRALVAAGTRVAGERAR
jgi:hypothetical protein